jgi:DUF2934 family protein
MPNPPRQPPPSRDTAATVVGHATATAAKPAKRATTTEPATPAEQAASSRTSRASTRKPSHDEISERAYFIALEEGDSDPAENWLRAERELASA